MKKRLTVADLLLAESVERRRVGQALYDLVFGDIHRETTGERIKVQVKLSESREAGRLEAWIMRPMGVCPYVLVIYRTYPQVDCYTLHDFLAMSFGAGRKLQHAAASGARWGGLSETGLRLLQSRVAAANPVNRPRTLAQRHTEVKP